MLGNNEVVKCDNAGAFQFVFVKAGSVAIVILRDGSLSVFQPGNPLTLDYMEIDYYYNIRNNLKN